MSHFALIGQTLVHSYSKRYFDARFAAEHQPHTYELVELARIEDVGLEIERRRLSGFNVTIPYKQQIMPLLSGISQEAREIGAVNVVALQGHQLVGFNTDAPAFLQTLKPHLRSYHTAALVLGTGGASRAVAYALRQLGIRYTLVSRAPRETDQIDYDEANRRIKHTPILINATPAGTYPHVDEMPPIDTSLIGRGHLVYDLIYNPSPSRLLSEARHQRADIIDGLGMLHRQADLSFEIWEQYLHKKLPTDSNISPLIEKKDVSLQNQRF